MWLIGSHYQCAKTAWQTACVWMIVHVFVSARSRRPTSPVRAFRVGCPDWFHPSPKSDVSHPHIDYIVRAECRSKATFVLTPWQYPATFWAVTVTYTTFTLRRALTEENIAVEVIADKRTVSRPRTIPTYPYRICDTSPNDPPSNPDLPA